MRTSMELIKKKNNYWKFYTWIEKVNKKNNNSSEYKIKTDIKQNDVKFKKILGIKLNVSYKEKEEVKLFAANRNAHRNYGIYH